MLKSLSCHSTAHFEAQTLSLLTHHVTSCSVPVTSQGVGLGLMTFAFKYMDEDTENTGNGQKSMVKSFLSLEIWQPLGKLTYVMYLIHLIVYLWWAGDLETPTYYTEWNELLLVLGI